MTSRFANDFETSVLRTVQRYSLASKNGRVLVACSGGKDSTSVLSILHGAGYSAEALHIDLGIGEWSESNRKNISDFCSDRGITLHIASTRDYFGSSVCHIKSLVQSRSDLTSCAICGVMKKWILNRKAKELEAQRLATGHNLDDEARTFIMNLVNGNPELNLYASPGRIFSKSQSLFVPRIKPLFFMRATQIERYSREMAFPVLYERCPCSKGSFGRTIYEDISSFEEWVPGAKDNIVETFLSLQTKLSAKNRTTTLECKLCGEPSRSGICRTCSMLLSVRSSPSRT